MAVHNKAINKLSPADYAMINGEHKQLEKYLADLRDACVCSQLAAVNMPVCIKEQQTSCQGRMPSFLFHIIELAGRHFDHEEAIMLSRPHVTENYEYFRIHRQAHLDIMQSLHGLAETYSSATKKTNTAEVYRLFHEKIASLFGEHDRLFDDPFVESTQQKTVN